VLRRKAGLERQAEIFRRYSELSEGINRWRQELRRKGKAQVRKACFDAMPVMEIDKQIDAMVGVESGDLTTFSQGLL
jgi:hypothetical protein